MRTAGPDSFALAAPSFTPVPKKGIQRKRLDVEVVVTPEDEVQLDLFHEQMSGDLSPRDDRALLEFPFFSLQKKPRLEPMIFSDDRRGITIRVEAGPKGIATIWDKDVLLYCESVLNRLIDERRPVGRQLRICAHDVLKFSRRQSGKAAYDGLREALERLHTTRVATNITAGNQSVAGSSFHWIEEYSWRRMDDGRMPICLTLPRWLFLAITEDRRVLRTSPEYFDLGKSLERRLYEIARKHCGNQIAWPISLEKLAQKCGTANARLRDFKADLIKIAADNNLPEYEMSVVSHAEAAKMISHMHRSQRPLFDPESGDSERPGIKVVFTLRAEMRAPQGQTAAYL
jgi:plasmid replication initiation protein